MSFAKINELFPCLFETLDSNSNKKRHKDVHQRFAGRQDFYLHSFTPSLPHCQPNLNHALYISIRSRNLQPKTQAHHHHPPPSVPLNDRVPQSDLAGNDSNETTDRRFREITDPPTQHQTTFTRATAHRNSDTGQKNERFAKSFPFRRLSPPN